MLAFYFGILSATLFLITAKLFRKVPDNVLFGESKRANKAEFKHDIFWISYFSFEVYNGYFVPFAVTMTILFY